MIYFYDVWMDSYNFFLETVRCLISGFIAEQFIKRLLRRFVEFYPIFGCKPLLNIILFRFRGMHHKNLLEQHDTVGELTVV